ncbi:MAG: SDR family oxidoreductase [Clostridia bacterium]|nr:SDR family oxidoreductase [Clostridia bacterium]
MKKVILVIGGSAGIGEAVAKEIANAYEKDVVIIGRNEEKMKTIAKENCRIEYIKTDITNNNEIEELIKQLKNKYIISAIVNSATVQNLSMLNDITDEIFDESMNVNVKAPLKIISKIVEQKILMEKGRILFISSTSRYNIQKGMGLYSISKAASFALTNVMKKEYNNQYLVSSLYPGTIFGTKTAKGMADSEIPEILELRKKMKEFLHNNKQIRILSPEQSASFINWVLLKTTDEEFSNPVILLKDNIMNALSDDEWDIRDCKLYEGCPIECGELLRDLSEFLGG